MSYVQIDDFECECSNDFVIAELNIKTGEYTCFKCGKVYGGKNECM
jgi:hypothetical protein